MESNGSIIYEWQNDNEVRFRVVIDKIKVKDVQKKNEGEGHSSTPLSSPGKSIITFYSDRNLNARMVFKNPAVREFYESKKLENVEIK